MAGSPTSSDSDNANSATRVELKDPSRTIYIHEHHLLGTTIQATDLTSHLAEPYGSDNFVASALQLAWAKCKEDGAELKPTYTIKRGAFSKTMDVTDNTTGQQVATWKMPLLGAHASELTFPADSKHSSHPITVTPFLLRLKESFVVDSVQHAWKIERKADPLDVRFKLVKTVAGSEKVVARYSHPRNAMGKGGILCVDESEVDVVVALVTCCIMIKKRTQKDLESFGVAS